MTSATSTQISRRSTFKPYFHIMTILPRVITMDANRNAQIIVLLDGVIIPEPDDWANDLVEFHTRVHAAVASVLAEGDSNDLVQDARNRLLDAMDGDDQVEIDIARSVLLTVVGILSSPC